MSETILVTGASAGFGQAICRRLVADGYRVIGAARRLDKLTALPRGVRHSLFPLQMDVTEPSQIDHDLLVCQLLGRELMFWSIMLVWP